MRSDKMRYSSFKIIIGISAALILLTGVGAETPEMSFEISEIDDEPNEEIYKPYDTSEFEDITKPEDELFDHANSHPMNQDYSSMNWLADEAETENESPNEGSGTDDTSESGAESPDEDDSSNSESENNRDSSSSNGSSDSGTGNKIETKESWSEINASLSHSSADYNDTVYIEGFIEGNEKRRISVFLGSEKISELGPLNDSFRIPIEAKEVKNRELRIESGDTISTFDLEVNSPIDAADPEFSKCSTESSQEPLGFSMFHNFDLFGIHEETMRPCYDLSGIPGPSLFSSENSSHKGEDIRENYVNDSSNQSTNYFTGGFSQRFTGEKLFRDIRARVDRIQQDIAVMFDSG